MNNRGSVTILTALVVATLMIMMSASQQVTTVINNRNLTRSIAVKVGKRANGGAFTLVQSLLDLNQIGYIAELRGDKTFVRWTVVDNDTPFYRLRSNTATTGIPTVTLPMCNPLFYDGQTGTNIFAAQTLPDPTACTNQGIDLTTTATVGAPSNGGVWQRGKPNFVEVSVVTEALIALAAAGPTVPTIDTGRVPAHAPTPACTMVYDSNEIVLGQAARITLTSSLNTEQAQMQRPPSNSWVPFPVLTGPKSGGLADYATPQGGSVTFTPTATGVVTLKGMVYGPIDPETGTQGIGYCEASLTVYPPPSCTMYPNEPLITTDQSTDLKFQTNGNVTPIVSAIIDGTDVTADSAKTFVAKKNVSRNKKGRYTFKAAVKGVNGSTADCRATLAVEPPPTCKIKSPNVSQIISGDTVNITMTTNSLDSSISTSKLEGIDLPASGGTVKSAPSPLGSYTFNGSVNGPNGSVGYCKLEKKLTVYPAPYCGVTASPTVVETGESIKFTLTTNNDKSPIKSAKIDKYTVDKSGGSVTLSAPGTPKDYTINGYVTGVNSSSATCTSAAYTVLPRASCSVTPTKKTATLGDLVDLTLATNSDKDTNISGSKLCIDGICHTFDKTGGTVHWSTNGAADGEANFPASKGSFTFLGSATGSAATAGCQETVVVNAPPEPDCPYRNLKHKGTVSINGSSYNFGFEYNDTPYKSNDCTAGYCDSKLWEDAAHTKQCRFKDDGGIQVIDYGHTNAGKEDTTNPAYNPNCVVGENRCATMMYEQACSNPAVWIIVDLADKHCVPSVYNTRLEDGGCFAPETQITLADGSSKRADEIRNDDELLNPATGRATAIREMIRGPERVAMWRVGFGEFAVKVTKGHPFPTRRGTVAAARLKSSDEILGVDGDYHHVTELRQLPIENGQLVYNFELALPSDVDESERRVVAGGIVTGDLASQRWLAKRSGHKD